MVIGEVVYILAVSECVCCRINTSLNRELYIFLSFGGEKRSGGDGAIHNRDDHSPIDGKLIWVCYELVAYIEVSFFIGYGAHSSSLSRRLAR